MLILIPGLMDLRGDVYGAIGYRFTKGLHLGLTQPKLITRFNLLNVMTGYVVSITVTLFLCLMGLGLSSVGRFETPDITSLLFIATSSTLVVFAALTPVALTAIAYLFKRGRDPSPFVATIVTGVGDVLTPTALITIAYLHELLSSSVKGLVVVVASCLATLLLTYMVYVREWKDLTENLTSSVIGSSGSSLGGYFLAIMVSFIGENPEVLGVLPAFNAVVGAAMGYLSNSLNIDLHMGLEGSKRTFYRRSLTGSVATCVAVLLALMALSMSPPYIPLRLLRVTLSVTLSCLTLYAISTIITYLLTTISFHHGWDPDNLVFPVMTTFVDLMGPIVLLLISSQLLTT